MTTPAQEVKTFYRAYNKGSTEGALQDRISVYDTEHYLFQK